MQSTSKSILILSSHFHPYLSNGLFPLDSASKVLYVNLYLTDAMPTTCPTHLILDFITLITCGEDHLYQSSSLFCCPPLPPTPTYCPQHLFPSTYKVIQYLFCFISINLKYFVTKHEEHSHPWSNILM
jgi:hypothetical protein